MILTIQNCPICGGKITSNQKGIMFESKCENNCIKEILIDNQDCWNSEYLLKINDRKYCINSIINSKPWNELMKEINMHVFCYINYLKRTSMNRI